MYILSLSESKKHLNIEDYFTDDDNYIESLIDVSFHSIKNKCNNRNWVDHSGNTGGTIEFADQNDTDIPKTIKHAMLLMVGNFYVNREPVSFASASKIPYSVDYLIQPYVQFGYVWTTTTTTTISP